MTKSKILKVLPYWLAILGLMAIVQLGAVLIPQKNQRSDSVAQAAEPEVLGASASARGGNAVPDVLQKISEPDTSGIKAKSFLAFDLASGEALISRNADDELGIASLTKLMTGLVTYENANLNSNFAITGKDRVDVQPYLGLYRGDEVKALDVFNAMLIGSNNDAAQALADFTASTTGQNFVGLMNKEAANLEMAHSHFSNPIGFDSQYNYSTANDLEKLISQTEKLSAFMDLGRRESYKFSGAAGKTYSTVATNKLIKNHPDIAAIKTGYTDYSAGAMATKIKIGAHDIVILVLGSWDREGDTLKLKDALENSFK